MNLNEPLIPYRINNKWGFSTKDKVIVIPCIYETVNKFYNGFSEVTLSFNKTGIIDEEGNIVVPIIYAFISLVIDKSVFIVNTNEYKYGMYKDGKLIFDIVYDFIEYYGNNIYLININGKWSFVNIDNEKIFPNVELKSYNSPKPYQTSSKPHLIDNRVIIHKNFGIQVYVNGIKKDLKYELYEDIKHFKTRNKKYFYSNLYSRHSIDSRFESLIFYNDNFDILYPSNSLKDITIHRIILSYEENDFIVVEDDHYNSYLLDENFNLIKKLDFRVVSSFQEELAVVEIEINRKTKFGYINKLFNIVIPLVFSKAENFKNGFAKVKDNTLFGLINNKGDVVIPFQYYDIGNISDDKVAVQFSDDFSNSCGFINLQNQLISNNYYSFYYGGPYFISELGVAVVHKVGSGTGIINRSGKEILECKYFIEDASFFNGHIIFGEFDNDKFGILNYHGEIIIPAKYKKIYNGFRFGEYIFWYAVYENGESGYIDNNGIEFWEGPFNYNTI